MTYFFGWRVSVLLIFVASMFLTPADPLSLVLAAAGLLMIDFALSYGLKLALAHRLPR